MNKLTLWTQIQDHIKDRNNSPILPAPVESATPKEIKDGVLIVEVAELFDLLWLRDRLTSTVDKYLMGIEGVERVEFVGVDG